MKIAIIGAGKIGTALGSMVKEFCEVVYLDKLAPYDLNYKKIKDCEIIFIAVATTDFEKYDTSNVTDCLNRLKENKIEGQVAILSTCPPSFFDEPYDVIYNPLFIRQGNIEEDIRNAELVLLGNDSDNNSLIKNFYNKIRPDFHYVEVNKKEAATIKMGINGFLCLKVAYANMLGDYCIKQNINPYKVLQGISDCKSVNPYYFKYGFGYGGPCLPIDNATLADEIGNNWPRSVDQQNLMHLEFQIKHFTEKNTDRGLVYSFENLSYKKDVDIIVNSQKLEMAKRLAEMGYKILIKDRKSICELIAKENPGLFEFSNQ